MKNRRGVRIRTKVIGRVVKMRAKNNDRGLWMRAMILEEENDWVYNWRKLRVRGKEISSGERIRTIKNGIGVGIRAKQMAEEYKWEQNSFSHTPHSHYLSFRSLSSAIICYSHLESSSIHELWFWVLYNCKLSIWFFFVVGGGGAKHLDTRLLLLHKLSN